MSTRCSRSQAPPGNEGETAGSTITQPSPRFWTGRGVCVTGGSGFLGYHLVRQLLALGAEVRTLSLPPAADHPLRRQTDVAQVCGDVRDPDTVRRAVADCSVVFHTAGIVAISGPAL